MKSKTLALSGSTNASVSFTGTTTSDTYIDNFGTSRTRSRTERFGKIDVVNIDGGGIIYIRVDGTNPTVGGDNAYVVPALKDAQVSIPVDSSAITVRLISSAGASVAVIAN